MSKHSQKAEQVASRFFSPSSRESGRDYISLRNQIESHLAITEAETLEKVRRLIDKELLHTDAFMRRAEFAERIVKRLPDLTEESQHDNQQTQLKRPEDK